MGSAVHPLQNLWPAVPVYPGSCGARSNTLLASFSPQRAHRSLTAATKGITPATATATTTATTTTSVFTQRVTASSHQKPNATAGYALIPRLSAGSGGLRQAAIRACRSAVRRGVFDDRSSGSRQTTGGREGHAAHVDVVAHIEFEGRDRHARQDEADSHAEARVDVAEGRAHPRRTALGLAHRGAVGVAIEQDRCIDRVIFRLRPRLLERRRRLRQPQSPLSDRRSPLVSLRYRDRTSPGTMPPNCRADPGAPPKARPAPCSLDSGQTCDAAYFASCSSPFSLPLRPHSSGRQRRRQSSGHGS